MRLISLFKRDVWALERRAPGAALRLRGLLAEHAGTAGGAQPDPELARDVAG